MFEKKLRVTPSPHVKDGRTTQKIMLDVFLALVPAGIFSVYVFGASALVVIVTAVLVAVASEFLWQKVTKKPITISDFSAAVTGLLLAYNLPPSAPWWMAAIGSAFAIILVKQLFGGLGFNIVNPALAARAILMASWPARMTSFTAPFAVDAVSSPTLLADMSNAATTGFSATWGDVSNAFFGTVGGCIGETSAFLLLLGGAYLVYRKVINLRIPISMLGSAALMIWAFAGTNGLFSASGALILLQMFSGGLILGALFMATDYVTTPITPKGHIIFGIGCGVIAMLIRLFGGYAEGVSYAILIMNVASPLIERFTMPTPFGKQKPAKQKKEAGANA